jgi:hypothetical protein
MLTGHSSGYSNTAQAQSGSGTWLCRHYDVELTVTIVEYGWVIGTSLPSEQKKISNAN